MLTFNLKKQWFDKIKVGEKLTNIEKLYKNEKDQRQNAEYRSELYQEKLLSQRGKDAFK